MLCPTEEVFQPITLLINHILHLFAYRRIRNIASREIAELEVEVIRGKVFE